MFWILVEINYGVCFKEENKNDGQDDTYKDKRFIQRVQQVHQEVQEQLEKSQANYKERHDKHRFDHQFQFSDQVWLHINKDRMKGEGKKTQDNLIWPIQDLGEDWY
jgi:hypothetical protein